MSESKKTKSRPTPEWCPFGYSLSLPSVTDVSVQLGLEPDVGVLQCGKCRREYTEIATIAEHFAVDHVDYAPFRCPNASCTVARFSRQKLEQHIVANGHGQPTNFYYHEDETKRTLLLRMINQSVISRPSNQACFTEFPSLGNSTADQIPAIFTSNSMRTDDDISPSLCKSITRQSRRRSKLADRQYNSGDVSDMDQLIRYGLMKDTTPNASAQHLMKEDQFNFGGGDDYPLPLCDSENTLDFDSQPEMSALDDTGDSDCHITGGISTKFEDSQDIVARATLGLKRPPASDADAESKNKKKYKRRSSTNGTPKMHKPSEQDIICDVCNKNISVKTATRTHVWSHLKQPLYKCRLCPLTMRSTEKKHTKKMCDHVVEMHRDLIGDDATSDEGVYWSDEKPNFQAEIHTLIKQCFGERLPGFAWKGSVVFGSQTSSSRSVHAVWESRTEVKTFLEKTRKSDVFAEPLDHPTDTTHGDTTVNASGTETVSG